MYEIIASRGFMHIVEPWQLTLVIGSGLGPFSEIFFTQCSCFFKKNFAGFKEFIT